MPAPVSQEHPPVESLDLRERAWVGDAVLALVIREHILARGISFDSGANDRFQEWTSNQFLNRFGRPTEIEAWIGEIYLRDGLESARTAIQERFAKSLSTLPAAPSRPDHGDSADNPPGSHNLV